MTELILFHHSNPKRGLSNTWWLDGEGQFLNFQWVSFKEGEGNKTLEIGCGSKKHGGVGSEQKQGGVGGSDFVKKFED